VGSGIQTLVRELLAQGYDLVFAIETLPRCLRSYSPVPRGDHPLALPAPGGRDLAGGALPVMDGIKQEAAHRKVELLTVPTSEAIRLVQAPPKHTNAILHVTC
jgi:hypothetical protein